MKRLVQLLFLFATLTVCSNTDPSGPADEPADPARGAVIGTPRGPLPVPPPKAPVPPEAGPPPAAGPSAQLTIVKTAVPADVTIGPGDPLVFDIRVTNNSPVYALNVTLSDELPDLASTWTVTKIGGPPLMCEIVGGNLSCRGLPIPSDPFKFGIDLSPGGFFAVRISSPTDESDCGTVTNTAQAGGENAPIVFDSASQVIICPPEG